MHTVHAVSLRSILFASSYILLLSAYVQQAFIDTNTCNMYYCITDICILLMFEYCSLVWGILRNTRNVLRKLQQEFIVREVTSKLIGCHHDSFVSQTELRTGHSINTQAIFYTVWAFISTARAFIVPRAVPAIH